jgi:hypothetical protein
VFSSNDFFQIVFVEHDLSFDSIKKYQKIEKKKIKMNPFPSLYFTDKNKVSPSRIIFENGIYIHLLSLRTW